MSELIVKAPRITSYTLHYDQYSMIPDAFWFGRYRSLSYLAVIVYSKLTQRLKLAYENGWYNDKNEIYVQLKRSEMAHILHANKDSLRKAYLQLEELDLIEIDRQGQHEIDKIYIKLPIREEATTEELKLSDLRIKDK